MNRRQDETGSSAIQTAVVFPVLLLFVFGVIQGGFYFYARNAAMSAAETGVDKTRAQYGTTGQGSAAARQFLAKSVGGNIKGVSVRATRSQTQARVTVTGRSITLIPGFAGFPISTTASQPVERFTEPGDNR